jgi:hypothetical protein
MLKGKKGRCIVCRDCGILGLPLWELCKSCTLGKWVGLCVIRCISYE